MTNDLSKHAVRVSVFSLIFLAIATSFAFAFTADDKTLSPYFFVTGDPNIDRLPLKDTSVEIAISGVIADVKVTQRYRNEGRRPINAAYMFPASTRAAVYSMRMKIGNEVIVAKIKEREVAKQEFETAKKEGKSASLLEQQRPNVFSMKMANLMPKEEIEIELRYTELLIPTNGVYEMVYPTVVGPRYSSNGSDAEQASRAVKSEYKNEGTKPDSKLHISAQISAGLPIQNLKSTSHDIAPDWLDPTVAKLTLNDNDPFQGNRDFILNYSLAGNEIESGLLLFEGGDENFFLYMAQPPERVKPEDIPAREYVFVVDVSGSMEGFPLDTSKRLLEDLIGSLRPTDYFNVILFSADSTSLSDTPLPANRANISRAIQLIEEQRGLGGTELLGAMHQAMNLSQEPGVSRSIIVVTDGYISAEDGVFGYIRENLNKSNVFSFGIGSSVNRYLIEGVAKAGLGEPFVVTNETQAEKIAKDFRRYIESPVLTDVRLRPVGFETYDVFPLNQPDLLAERPVIVFGKWRGSITGTFELSGRNGKGDFLKRLDISGIRTDDANRALPYLWARSQIAEFSGFGFGNTSEEDVKKITALGLKYNLLTPYTSFIAVRELVRNPDGSATDVSQRLPLPVGVSHMAVGSEPGLMWILAAASIVALLLLLIHFRGRFVAAWRKELSL